MKLQVSGSFDSLLRAQGYLIANDAALADVNQSAARANLDAAIDALREQAYAQETARERGKGETSKQNALRITLGRQMRAIATIGRNNHGGHKELIELRHVPGNASLRVLLPRATVLLQVIDAYPAVFAEGGLSPEAVATFRATVAEVGAMVEVRQGTRNVRVMATRASTVHARAGRQAIQVLDALVKLAINGDAILLAGWKSAKRVHGARPAAAVELQEVSEAA
jgi:hypothetical protein